MAGVVLTAMVRQEAPRSCLAESAATNGHSHSRCVSGLKLDVAEVEDIPTSVDTLLILNPESAELAGLFGLVSMYLGVVVPVVSCSWGNIDSNIVLTFR